MLSNNPDRITSGLESSRLTTEKAASLEQHTMPNILYYTTLNACNLKWTTSVVDIVVSPNSQTSSKLADTPDSGIILSIL